MRACTFSATARASFPLSTLRPFLLISLLLQWEEFQLRQVSFRYDFRPLHKLYILSSWWHAILCNSLIEDYVRHGKACFFQRRFKLLIKIPWCLLTKQTSNRLCGYFRPIITLFKQRSLHILRPLINQPSTPSSDRPRLQRRQYQQHPHWEANYEVDDGVCLLRTMSRRISSTPERQWRHVTPRIC